jgi:hypothetical protein
MTNTQSTRTSRSNRSGSSSFTGSKGFLGYYALLGIATFLMAGYTILSGGAIAGYGHHVQQLQAEKIQLEQERQALQKQLSHETSLAAISDSVASEEFEAIGTPITVSGLTSVAQAQ